MKKFIIKFFITLIIWSTPLIVFLHLGGYYYYNMEYPMWKSKINYMNSKFNENKLIIGDSRALAGIYPGLLGNDFYNLALGGGTPLEGYYTLKKVLSNGNKIDLIVVSYSSGVLEWSSAFFDRQLKFDFYSIPEINEIFFKFNPNHELFWKFDDKTNFYKLLRDSYLCKFKWPFFYLTELRNMMIAPRYLKNMNVYQEINENKGQHLFGMREFCHDLNFEAKRKKFKQKEIIISSLYKIFSLAKENDIKVIYLVVPFNESSSKRMNSNYIKQYNSIFDEIKNKFPEVKIYSEFFSYPDTYFGDASHLNERGAIKFSNYVKSIIEENF